MSERRPSRRASAPMERWIPVILALLAALALVLVLVALAVVLGLWPG